MRSTHGELWLTKAHRRIEGWCKTRGWRCSSPRLTTPRAEQWKRYNQFEVFVSDIHGKTVSIAFDMYADEAQFVDDGGMPQGFDAVTFDNMMAVVDLSEKPKPSKRQLELSL